MKVLILLGKRNNSVSSASKFAKNARYRAFHTPGIMPSLASSRNIIRDIFVCRQTARGRPVSTQRMRIRDTPVLYGISESFFCASRRTANGSRDDITIDFNARL